MKECQEKFLNLLFDEGEEICVSDCQGGYHSISQDGLKNNDITLISPKEDKKDRKVALDKINLVAINPIEGWRRDKDVKKYRTFLIELDEGDLAEQKKYIDESGLPYSVCVFSGSKSLHYGIVLEEPLPSRARWKHIAQWILNILTEADQQCKNPSRSIRFPGNSRKETGKEQKLVEIKGRIKKEDLYVWINKRKDCKPVQEEFIPIRNNTKILSVKDIPDWIKEGIESGITKDMTESRDGWFFRATDSMHRKGFSYEETLTVMMKGIVDDFPPAKVKDIVNRRYGIAV